jgi:regulator of CtrA degradation
MQNNGQDTGGDSEANVSQTGLATAFFGRTYDEAMSLLVEAREYLMYREPLDRQPIFAVDQIQFCCETMRLTARLTHIMAWLLAQRAVHCGEISQEEALGDHQALAELEICTSSDEAEGAKLPRRLADLMIRSHRLYVRVARLDELARRQINEAACSSGA